MPQLSPSTNEIVHDLSLQVAALKTQVAQLESHGVPKAIADHEKRFTMWGTFIGVLAIVILAIVRCA